MQRRTQKGTATEARIATGTEGDADTERDTDSYRHRKGHGQGDIYRHRKGHGQGQG
jgi:hypothetical protein